MSDTVWTVGCRANAYHQDRSCIIDRRESGTVDVEPRETTVEKAKKRGLTECSHCSDDGYEKTHQGGNLSKLERILQEQEKQIADD